MPEIKYLKNRLTMNSQSIQKTLPEVYRDFFSRSTIAVSAPGCFFWGGEYAVLYGGIAIKQTVPLRIHVGIENLPAGQIEIGTVKELDPAAKMFKDLELPTTLKKGTINFLTSFIKEWCGKDFPGFKFYVVSEIPFSRGIDSSGAFSAAISTLIHLYLNKITTEKIKEWDQKTTQEMLNDQNFLSVFRLAWKIECIYHANSSSGAGAFAPFLNSSYPIIYFTEKKSGTYSNPVAGLKPVNFENHYEIVDQINFWGAKLEEIFNFKTTPSWPVDFGLIYSGNVARAESSIMTMDEIKEIFFYKTQEIKSQLSKINAIQSNPLNDEIFNNSESIWNTLINSIKIVTAMIFSDIKEVLKKGLHMDVLRSLFKSINMYHKSMEMLGLSSRELDELCTAFRKRIRRLGRAELNFSGTKLTGAGKYGDIVFAITANHFRKDFDKIMNHLQEKFGPDINLDYASWLDGFEEHGVRVEQNLNIEQYSDFITAGAFQIKHLSDKGILHTDLYSIEEFEQYKPTMDLLLDIPNNDIYVKGTSLSSKYIKSASATIDILKIMLQNPGKLIANSELPASSYAKDRNELQSKIISPLNIVLKKRLGKSLNLKISGGLLHFNITLALKGLNIYLIEKTF